MEQKPGLIKAKEIANIIVGECARKGQLERIPTFLLFAQAKFSLPAGETNVSIQMIIAKQYAVGCMMELGSVVNVDGGISIPHEYSNAIRAYFLSFFPSRSQAAMYLTYSDHETLNDIINTYKNY